MPSAGDMNTDHVRCFLDWNPKYISPGIYLNPGLVLTTPKRLLIAVGWIRGDSDCSSCTYGLKKEKSDVLMIP